MAHAVCGHLVTVARRWMTNAHVYYYYIHMMPAILICTVHVHLIHTIVIIIRGDLAIWVDH